MPYIPLHRPDVCRRKKSRRRAAAAGGGLGSAAALRSPSECEAHRVMRLNALFLLELAAEEAAPAAGAAALAAAACTGPFPAVALQCLHTLGGQQAHLRRLKEDELSAELRRQSDAEKAAPAAGRGRLARRSGARPVSACVSRTAPAVAAPRDPVVWQILSLHNPRGGPVFCTCCCHIMFGIRLISDYGLHLFALQVIVLTYSFCVLICLLFWLSFWLFYKYQ